MKKKLNDRGIFSLHFRPKQGSALVIAIIISVVIAILALVGTQLMLTDFQNVKQQQYLISNADSVARAGISDAIAWFMRQPNQPVKSGYPPTTFAWADGAFNPQISTNPLNSDTIDASIGIVKQYELSDTNSLWARYEVHRQTNPAVSPYNQFAVHDVSGERLAGQQDGDGDVWYIPSYGYIYRNLNPALPYNTPPNQVVASSLVSTEILKVTLTLQVPVAYIVNNGGPNGNPTVQINNNGRIYGGTYGCGRSSGANPQINAGATVTGTSAQYNPKSFMLTQHTVQYVLGVSTAQLRILSDYYVPRSASCPQISPICPLSISTGTRHLMPQLRL